MFVGIRGWLAGTLTALLLIILALSALTLSAQQETVDAYAELNQRAVAPANELSALARALLRQRMYLSQLLAETEGNAITGFRATIKEEDIVLATRLQALDKLLPGNPELVSAVAELKFDLGRYEAAKQRDLDLLDAGKLALAKAHYKEAVTEIGGALRKRIDAQIEALDARTEARLQERRATFEQRRRAMTIALLLIMVAAAAVGWRLFVSVMTPVRRMRGVLHAIGAGDLATRVVVYRPDELGDLAEAINLAGTQLQEADERSRSAAAQQQRETELLRQGVDRLLQVTEAAASGDLTQSPGPLEGEDMIRLGASVSAMVDGLRKLVGDLQSSMVQIRGCTTDLTASVRDNESTLAEQASSSTEVAATSTEMAQNANELAVTMRRVSETNEAALERAEQGRESLLRLDRTIGQILSASGDISAALGALATKSADITSVVTAITRVADQTNLLSLNAAIEAEKAGEYGQGFSVIAGEIRRLSDQTTEAAGHIEQIVREMHTAISTSVLSMDRFNDQVRRNVDDVGALGDVLSGVIESVEGLAPRIESASDSMRAQADGAAQINEAIRQIHDSITHAHRSMSTTSDATAALMSVAQRLQQGVGRFHLA
jgi:methyl-accepting chemotaxis protein WspA